MTDAITLPGFVEDADTKHPGVIDEYSQLKALVSHLFAQKERSDLNHAVMLQSGIAWQHYNAILLLLAHDFGIQSLILCRTLFEVVTGALHLMKNPGLLTDFTDHGKLLLYERGLAAGLPAHELLGISRECEAIKARRKSSNKGQRKSWHGSNVREIATAVGLGEAYRLLYPDASSASHADASKTLSYGLRGWKQSLNSFRSEREADIVHYVSFFIIGYLLYHLNKDLGMGRDKEADAVLTVMTDRAKSAARPN